MKKILLISPILISTLFAHSAIMSCFDNGDGTITCEGGFSDGSSANGVEFIVESDGSSILKGKMDEYSEFTFNKPEKKYSAVFNAGEGHKVYISGDDITE